MRFLRSLLRRQDGASAVEFAVVLIPALGLLFAIIDVGRYIWTINQMEKATQTGARVAVVTSIVPQGLNSFDFTSNVANKCNLPEAPKAGSPICADAMGTIRCTGSEGSVSCTCASGECDATMIGTANAQAFNRIITAMQTVTPEATADTVKISYSGSGIGFLGDPHVDAQGEPLSDVSPVVTVEIDGSKIELRLMTLLGYGLTLPKVKSSLTLEDGDGTQAY